MDAHEFGIGGSRKIVLIPGNMMCWRQFEGVIPFLEGDYHVTAISTDGYDGSRETTFTSAEASAQKLEDYIRRRLDGGIDMVFGESFGCATAGMLFHRQKVRVGSMILSGPQYMRLGALTGLMKAIIPRNQYRLIDRMQTQKKLPWLLKLYTRTDDEKLLAQFRNIPPNISFATLKNAMDESLALYDAIDGFNSDPAAHVAIWHGAREPNMRAALQKLIRAWPGAEDRPFEGFGHGEIISNPEMMAAEIRRFMGDGDISPVRQEVRQRNVGG